MGARTTIWAVGLWSCLFLGVIGWAPAARAAELDLRVFQDSPLLLASLLEEEKRPLRRPLDEAGVEKHNTGWAFYLDNDLFAPGGHDRDYTGGFSLTLSGTRARESWYSIDPLLGWMNHGAGKQQQVYLHNLELGMTAFTPENIEAKTALSQDRPYASLLYLSNSRIYTDPLEQRSLITSLTIGVLGLDVVGDVQNSLHAAIDIEEAEGWDNQISDGGEPTLRYSIASQAMRGSRYGTGRGDYEIKTTARASIGYLTDVSWGVSGRIGRLRSPWWAFNPQISDYAEKSTPIGAYSTSNNGDEFYFWGGMNLRLRLYNAFLQGQFRDSEVTYDRDELRHGIAELWMGVTKEYANGVRLSYFLRGQSAEIRSGDGSRNPIWGGIIISRAY